MVQGRSAADGQAKTVHSLEEDVHEAISEVQQRQHRLACVAANLPFGLHEYLDRPLTYFALMREPVSRCISYWHFAYRTRNDSRVWSRFETFDFDLRQILEKGVALALSNDQVRMLSGSPARYPGEEEFRRACETIQEHFVLVGAVEYFAASIRTIAERLGWARIPDVHENRGVRTEAAQLSHDADAYFGDANEWDIRLYEWLIDRYLPHHLH